MPCKEIDDAIATYAPNPTYEVTVYFTKHYGTGTFGAVKDAVHYASGPVAYKDSPAPHLEGTLPVSKNTENPGAMVVASNLEYVVQIFQDGTVTYVLKLNGQPVGGASPTKVLATCVNGVLLTATTGSEVMVIGVASRPKPFA